MPISKMSPLSLLRFSSRSAKSFRFKGSKTRAVNSVQRCCLSAYFLLYQLEDIISFMILLMVVPMTTTIIGTVRINIGDHDSIINALLAHMVTLHERFMYISNVTPSRTSSPGCLSFLKCSTESSGFLVKYLLWFSCILSLNFISFYFKLIIIHYHSPKQMEIQFKPRMKLNHNISTRKWSITVMAIGKWFFLRTSLPTPSCHFLRLHSLPCRRSFDLSKP